jgi:hypothetical protein
MEFLVVRVNDVLATEVPSPANWIYHRKVVIVGDKTQEDDDRDGYGTNPNLTRQVPIADALNEEKTKVGAWDGPLQSEIGKMLTHTTLPLTGGENEVIGRPAQKQAIAPAFTKWLRQ